MEENWINKLIELLDEYDSVQYHKINHKIENWDIYRNVWGTDGWHQVCRYCKKFWFIQWLVENDKIKPLRKFIGWETDEDEPYIQFDLVDQYIAYLSIQDNSIDFLISILK